jgi:hypothetical protein
MKNCTPDRLSFVNGPRSGLHGCLTSDHQALIENFSADPDGNSFIAITIAIENFSGSIEA